MSRHLDKSIKLTITLKQMRVNTTDVYQLDVIDQRGLDCNEPKDRAIKIMFITIKSDELYVLMEKMPNLD